MPESRPHAKPARRPAIRAAKRSPLRDLAEASGSAHLAPGLDEAAGPFMRQLCDQFGAALAEGKLETALAMLAGCPGLAAEPCRKARFSALHWSCADPKLAPATRALLALGCDPLGHIPTDAPHEERVSNTPLRWAVSSGSVESLAALIGAGARPELDDLFEACRNAQGGCALAIFEARPELDPFEPVRAGAGHCFSVLAGAARSGRDSMVNEALCAFELDALRRGLLPGDFSAPKRL